MEPDPDTAPRMGADPAPAPGPGDTSESQSPAAQSEPAPETASQKSRVLSLSPNLVEWAYTDSRGKSGRIAVKPERDGPEGLADAAAKARAQADVRGRACVVLLDGELVRERVLELPPLGAHQRRGLLQRRADQLVGERALYSATRLSARADAPGERWLLLALPRESARSLFRALEARGLRPKAALPAALAQLALAPAAQTHEGGPTALVCVEPEQVLVSLLRGGHLEHQTALPGNLVESAVLGASLVHELRSLEALWRKERQGESIAKVCVLGLSAPRAQALFHALRGVLPQAEPSHFPLRAQTADDARATLLLAMVRSVDPSLDLFVPAPRRVRASAVGVALAALAGAAGIAGARPIQEQRAEALAMGQTFRAESADLEDLRSSHQRVSAMVLELEREVRLIETARGVGLDGAGVLAALEQAFGEGFVLQEQRLDPDGVRVSGTFRGTVRDASRALSQAAKVLEAHPSCGSLDVVPLSRKESEPELLPFELRFPWRMGN